MKKINSRAKGQRGELLWRDVLKSKGLTARRGQQYCGANGDSDVICEELKSIHFEVKFMQNFNARKALAQAKEDAKDGQISVVVQKSKKKDWIAVMDAEEFLGLLLACRELREYVKNNEHGILDGGGKQEIDYKKFNEDLGKTLEVEIELSRQRSKNKQEVKL